MSGGDVAGGCPQKYVTGALAEGEIAGLSAVKYIDSKESFEKISNEDTNYHLIETEKYLTDRNSLYTTEQLEEAMQTVMDSYAGGIKTTTVSTKNSLTLPTAKSDSLKRSQMTSMQKIFQELMYICELKERLTVCKSVIAHLRARKETRWHSFAENLDYPEKDDRNFNKYVNSRLENGEIKIIIRDLVTGGEKYEHSN